MLAYILLLLAAVVVWGYLKWSRVKRYWADRGVPHDEPHPILGSLTFFQKKNPGEWVREIYERFPTPYVGIWLFWRPALIINSPEIARRVLVKDHDAFRNRLSGTSSEKTDPIGGLNLFASNDPFWSTMRRRLTPLFTSAKLKSFHSLVTNKANLLQERIQTDLKNNKPSELRDMYVDYTTDLITVAAFGIESNSVSKEESPMRKIVAGFMKFNVFRGLSWCFIAFLPEVVNFFRMTLFPKSAMDKIRQIHKTVIADRGGYTNEFKHNDLMDYLRKMKYEANQKNEELSEDALLAQSAIFLQGGFDTSGSSLTFTTIELSQSPDVQERLYQELKEAKDRLGDKDFDGESLAELPYLNACIKETIRKYVPLGWLDRIAGRDYQIDEKLTITKGTPVYVNSMGMHYDPKYFPEPMKYNPERFLPENEKKIVPFTYLPFGEGPRNCIGLRFAQMSLRYAISKIVLKYEIRPKPGAKKPCECKIDNLGLIYAPGEPLYVDFVPRY